MPAFTESRAAAEPPLAESYLDLLHRGGGGIAPPAEVRAAAVEERELPLIDLGCLMATGGGGSRGARAACADAMARAASEWGFFQVTGHGVGRALLERLRAEQARLFRLPFETKARAGLLNGSYRWGAPTATSLRHLSWSEAFHVPLASISGSGCDFGELGSLRYAPPPPRMLAHPVSAWPVSSSLCWSCTTPTACCYCSVRVRVPATYYYMGVQYVIGE
jgi:gibberellin 2-oxidase